MVAGIQNQVLLLHFPENRVFYCQQGQILTWSSLKANTTSLFQNTIYHITKASADTLQKEPHKDINTRLWKSMTPVLESG